MTFHKVFFTCIEKLDFLALLLHYRYSEKLNQEMEWVQKRGKWSITDVMLAADAMLLGCKTKDLGRLVGSFAEMCERRCLKVNVKSNEEGYVKVDGDNS